MPGGSEFRLHQGFGLRPKHYVYFRRTAQKRRGPEGRFSEMLYLFRMHMPKSRLSAAAESLLFV